MKRYLIVDNPQEWSLKIPNLVVIAAKDYASTTPIIKEKRARVYNLCKSFEYQSFGYYVSLLAEARGHLPIPTVLTIQDMKSQGLSGWLLDNLETLIEKTLEPRLNSKNTKHEFTLSIYFGKTLNKRDQHLGEKLFELFRCPTLRAQFVHGHKWKLQSIRPIGMDEVPASHQSFLRESMISYLSRRHIRTKPKTPTFWLGILHDPSEHEPPSDNKALAKFIKAAEKYNITAELITKEDYWQLGEYDALFIRATTKLNHYTYRFARKAEADGLVVIDDPLSIARCTNKVFQTECLSAHQIAMPNTLIVHEGNIEEALSSLRFPVVLKQPDSCFSIGVVKVNNKLQYLKQATELLEKSDLIIAQEFIPTEYDWRVGIMDGEPIFVCKYFMARGHWQIMKHTEGAATDYGNHKAMEVEDAPAKVIQTALKAANLIGNGLYGVDLKQHGNNLYVIEINDNPNIDAGVEDQILKDELYERIMAAFARRIYKLQPAIGEDNEENN